MWVIDPQNIKIVFLGSKTHFFISDTYIFHSESIWYVILHPQNWFIIIPDLRNRLFRWKNGYLTPKTWFLVFFGSYAHFFMRGTHFFVSERICYWIWNLFGQQKWTFQVKMWVFDPQNTKIVFLGSKTHFFISDTYIFHSESICYVILHLLWKRKYTL